MKLSPSGYFKYLLDQVRLCAAPLLILGFGIFSSMLIFVTLDHELGIKDHHLIWLADSFSQLNLSYGMNHPTGDVVDYHAVFYSYFGPMASVVLIPFVLIWDRNFPQITLGLVCLFLSYLSVYVLATRLKYSVSDRLWWANFVVFSTVLLAVSLVDVSAYLVQSLATVFVLLSLVEYYGKRRYWLIGALVAGAGATRLTLFLITIFYALEWWRLRRPIKDLMYLLLPIVLVVGLLGIYNFRRFGQVGESGYQYNITLENYPMSQNIEYGFLSWRHVPTNLYAMLLKVPDPVVKSGGGLVLEFPYLRVNPWGLSLFISSPLLLLFFSNSAKKKYKVMIRNLLITTGVILLPALFYFGIGFSQFGYRYALDFLPLLLVVMILKLQPGLRLTAKFLIVIGVFFNCLFLMSLWGYYPHIFLTL